MVVWGSWLGEDVSTIFTLVPCLPSTGHASGSWLWQYYGPYDHRVGSGGKAGFVPNIPLVGRRLPFQQILRGQPID